MDQEVPQALFIFRNLMNGGLYVKEK